MFKKIIHVNYYGTGERYLSRGRRVHFQQNTDLDFYSSVNTRSWFYSSVLFEVPKLKSGKSALEAESESLDSYTADSDSTSRWSFPVCLTSANAELSFCSLALGCRFLLPWVFLISVLGLLSDSFFRPHQKFLFSTSTALAQSTASWSEIAAPGCRPVEDSAMVPQERGCAHLCVCRVACLIFLTPSSWLGWEIWRLSLVAIVIMAVTLFPC